MSAADGAVLQVRVVARAGRSEIVHSRSDGETLVVRLAAAPVEGAANNALTRFLAQTLDVPRSGITIIGGERSRIKRVRFAHLTPQQLATRLLALALR